MPVYPLIAIGRFSRFVVTTLGSPLLATRKIEIRLANRIMNDVLNVLVFMIYRLAFASIASGM